MDGIAILKAQSRNGPSKSNLCVLSVFMFQSSSLVLIQGCSIGDSGVLKQCANHNENVEAPSRCSDFMSNRSFVASEM